MDPREHFERIQRSLQSRGRGLGGAGGPGGRAFGGIILLGAAGVILSNSLFNGWEQSLNEASSMTYTG